MENSKSLSLEEKVKSCYSAQPFPNLFQVSKDPEPIAKRVTKWIRTNLEVMGVLEAQPKTILVAGCGTGEEVVALARIFPHAQITAVDMTDQSLEIALLNMRDFKVTTVTLMKASIIEDMSTWKNQFDLVFSNGVVHHLANPQEGFNNLSRLVAPNGRLVLSLYHSYGLFFYRLQLLLLTLLAGSNFEKRRKWALRFGYAKGRGETVLYDSYVHPQVKTYSIGTIQKWGRAANLPLVSVSPPLSFSGLIWFAREQMEMTMGRKKLIEAVLAIGDLLKTPNSGPRGSQLGAVRIFLFQLIFLIFRKGECWYCLRPKT